MSRERLMPVVKNIKSELRHAIFDDSALWDIESMVCEKVLYVAEPTQVTMIATGKAIRIPYEYIEELKAIRDDAVERGFKGGTLDWKLNKYRK